MTGIKTLLLPLAMLVGLAALAGRALERPALAQEGKKPEAAKVEQARQTVNMLDHLYKNAVVSITNNYVDQQSDAPAAMIAKEVFAAMEKAGWHKARLVDATGKPKNKENLPKTEFEIRAVAEIRGGKASIEEVAVVDGKHVFRAATVVPAVLKQCVVCHGRKEGAVLGVIVYELPIK